MSSRKELQIVVNKYTLECGSNRPDFLLAGRRKLFPKVGSERKLIKTRIEPNTERIEIQRETICYGCYANVPSNSCTYLPIIYEDTRGEAICPCSMCLIKSMCSEEKGCEMIGKYYKLMVPIRDKLLILKKGKFKDDKI